MSDSREREPVGGVREYASLEAYLRVPRAERRALVDRSLAVHIAGALAPDRAAAWARRALEARADYTYAFGTQASLGNAWYTHLEEGLARRYFETAAASDARVRRHIPGFQRTLITLAGALLGVTPSPRRGYAGPGVHVFDPGGECARDGGEVHSDTEGLPAPYALAGLPAYTLVVALSRVASGGGLRLWDAPYGGHDDPSLAELAEPDRVGYAPGDAVFFESYRLHQIEPFGGDAPRVTGTCHLARFAGRWEAWF